MRGVKGEGQRWSRAGGVGLRPRVCLFVFFLHCSMAQAAVAAASSACAEARRVVTVGFEGETVTAAAPSVPGAAAGASGGDGG